MKRTGLWTRDYTRITLASILSIIGGEAINIPIGLLVFDETRSTLLFQLLAGALGQLMPYRAGVALVSGATLLAAVALIVVPAEVNRRVYEATRH